MQKGKKSKPPKHVGLHFGGRWANFMKFEGLKEKRALHFLGHISLFTEFWVGFSGGSAVKNWPVMQEMQVQSLDREDALEEGMATHSSILA